MSSRYWKHLSIVVARYSFQLLSCSGVVSWQCPPSPSSLPQWDGGGSRMRKLMGQDGLFTNQCWGKNTFTLGVINIVLLSERQRQVLKQLFSPLSPTSLLTSVSTLIVPLSCSFLFTLFPCSCAGTPQITLLIKKYPLAYSRVIQGLQWGHFHCCGTASSPFSDLAVPLVLLFWLFYPPPLQLLHYQNLSIYIQYRW